MRARVGLAPDAWRFTKRAPEPNRARGDPGSPAARRSRSEQAMNAVFDDRAGMQSALADEQRAVDPPVALVAGLEPRRGAEIVLRVLARARAGVGRVGGLVVLDQAEVLDVNRRPVVGLDRQPHVEPAPAV